MMLVRPAQRSDLAALLSLAESAPREVHGLPRSSDAITFALDASLKSFNATVTMAGAQTYFFAMEDTDDGSLAGAAMLHASAGAARPYLAFRNELLRQAGPDNGSDRPVESLTLSADLSGFSQLAGFALREADHDSEHALLLSRAPLMFAAMAPHRFAENFFATLPGMCDEDGESPFWNALGRQYFDMHHLDAADLVDGTRRKSLIAELMPDFSVPVASLPEQALDAMGQSSAHGGKPVRRLMKEGFLGGEFIDFYDGGPIFLAPKKGLRSFVGSMRRTVAPLRDAPESDEKAITYLISTLVENRFRALLADCLPVTQEQEVALTPAVMQALCVTAGDIILCVEL
jgi:arginine N-succinyltransferase